MNSKDINTLCNSKNYITGKRCIFGNIIEYDIKSANINILLDANIISIDFYNYLNSLPKIDREKKIGLMIRSDSSIWNCISKGVIDSRRQLLSLNNWLNFDDIVRIANDAIFINSTIPLKYCQFNHIIYRPKRKINIMVNINNILIYIWKSDNGIEADVSGLGKASIYHRDYLLTIIVSVFWILYSSSIENAMEYFLDMYKQYIERKLPIKYYREFNSYSLYTIKGTNFKISDAKNIDDIDISYNLNILREVYSILLDQINSTKKI